jgi:uncharacterized protein YhaN
MRIEAIRIDGYGIHSGLEINDLPPGLTIVTGPNEAGKTTILDFIRGVLFDFPNRAKRTLPFHEPLRGGRHGGAVTLIDTLGRRWYLERHVGEKEPRLTNEEGEVASPAMLSVLLGGANDALFRNVFAFGLGELASFSSLNSDEVRERVFSAGVLGAGRSANQAIKQIEAQQAKLVKHRQGASMATDLQKRLSELDDNLREARRGAERYPALIADQREAEARLESARDEAEKLRGRTAELTHLVTLEPVWRDRNDANASLQAMGPVDDLERIVLERRDAVRRLVRDESGHGERVAVHRAHLDAIARAGEELEGVRRRLGGVRIVDVPFSVTGSVEHLRAELPNAMAELHSAEDALRSAAATDTAAALAIREIDGDAHPRPRAEITANFELAAQLDASVKRVDDLEKQHQEAKLRLEIEQLRARRERGSGDHASVAALYGVGALLAIFGAIVTVIDPGHSTLGRALGVVAILAAVVVALLAWHLATRLRKPTATTDLAINPDIADARAAITACSAILGLGDDARAQLPGLFARLREEREVRKTLDELEHDRLRTASALRDAEQRRNQARSVIANIDQQAAKAARELGLSDDLGLSGLTRALDELGRGRRLEEQIAEHEKAASNQLQEIEAFDGALHGLEAALGLDGLGDVAFRTERLSDLLESASVRTQERKTLGESVDRADRQLDSAFGNNERATLLMSELALGTVEIWRAEQQRLSDALSVANERGDLERDQVRDITQTADALRLSADVAEFATSRESTNAALQGVLAQWLSLGVGKALLEECLARYRRDRQPKVVNYASELFREITDGRYSRLAVVGDDGKDASIAALDGNGQVVDATNLSTGAKEQLYLTLRLAFAATFAEEATTLPIVVDDVTANADDDRQLTVATILGKVSEHHQVIAFTCHQRLVEVLVEKTPDARVIQLA